MCRTVKVLWACRVERVAQLRCLVWACRVERVAQLRCLVLRYCGRHLGHSFFLDRCREFLDRVRHYSVLVRATVRSGIVVGQMSASGANTCVWVRETKMSLLTKNMSIILYETILVTEDGACNISRFGNKVQNTLENEPGMTEGSFSDGKEVEYRWERLWMTEHVSLFILWVSRQNA